MNDFNPFMLYITVAMLAPAIAAALASALQGLQDIFPGTTDPGGRHQVWLITGLVKTLVGVIDDLAKECLPGEVDNWARRGGD